MIDTVLLIDDSESDMLFTRLMIERSGIAREVVGFESARDALALLTWSARPRFDLVLLDINLPGMDGFAFLDELEQRPPGGPPVKIVMLTSSPDPADRQRALSHAHVLGYVVKPIDKSGLAELQRVATAP